MSAAELSIGDSVDVLVSQPFDWDTRTEREPKWIPGFRVTGFSTGYGRLLRINVDGPRVYRDCAPECVRPAQELQP